ncbi:cytoplasmic dynein with WD40 domain [Clydaea vesicula]|uniref:Cytoplasmic dynein with WD40 domain n=1 Tax=Clydaea vesicula TaxID=447962 RepID=A0AAD5XUW2_9FUNG|nr:cytoplasmic dynein with WD40 domain [Clydaea vesicula]
MKSTRRTKIVDTLAGRSLSTSSMKSVGADPEVNTGGGEDWLPSKTLLKPPGQCILNEKELNEEFTRILNANNPKAPHNVARFNHKEHIFKASPNVDHLVVHFEFDGYLVFKEDAINAEDGESSVAPAVETEEKKKPLLRNQFNFSERAAQTFNNPTRERSSNTEPPPTRVLEDEVTQFSIYDAYCEDALQKEKAAKEKPRAGKGQKDEEKPGILPSEAHNEDVYNKNAEFGKSIIIIERMANQNTYDDISQDYKFWEDASDELGDRKSGTLLPLWKFVCEKTKRKQVTAVCWNPKSPDLFAVAYGSYDFSKQGPGMIACFTLKNPSYPEYLYITDSGVLCLDFHPQHPSMMAVGLYDGSVMIYNLQKKSEGPIFKSTTSKGKHTDPVWQVCWQKDDLDDNANFFSVSSDGRVSQWTLIKNELIHTDVIRLSIEALNNPASVIPIKHDEERLFDLAEGCCFDFHKKIDHLFVVGTEEGKIHKCSKAYNNQYLLSFEGHSMGVYTVKYNPFLCDVFLSASADWTVKLWDHNSSKPLMSFDLSCPVGDVAWAPYSSSVFAACTADGKLNDVGSCL